MGEGMRVATALAIIAVAWAAAVFLHERKVGLPCGWDEPRACPTRSNDIFYRSTIRTHPSWEDPVAVGMAIGSLAIGAAIVALGTRSHTARL